MRAGLFSTMQVPTGRPEIGPARLLDRIVAAEAAGFESVWLAERHFTGYGVIGNPVVFAAAVAARTSRVKIGFAALILALHNPFELAEQLVMLDNLSNGRIIAGFGTGKSKKEYGGLGIDVEQRHARFDEGLEIVQRVWQGDPFDHDGPQFSGSFPGLLLRPVQQPHPPLIRAIVHDESIVASAKMGIPILLGRFYVEQLSANLDLYTRTLRECGASEDRIRWLLSQSGVLRHVVVGETDAEADDLATRCTYGYIDRANEVFEPHEFDEFYPKAIIAGAPETVLRKIEPLAALGLGRVLCWLDFGGMDPDVADRNVARFAAEVLPNLERLPVAV
jgi:alkanesulfonate monooxygenase SsuD/methylene tetrahydromethanopterin reductase-like flavin-dependent oxidoreductase (luciferase family)